MKVSWLLRCCVPHSGFTPASNISIARPLMGASLDACFIGGQVLVFSANRE